MHYALQLQTGCQLGPEVQSPVPSYLPSHLKKEIQSKAPPAEENEVSWKGPCASSISEYLSFRDRFTLKLD